MPIGNKPISGFGDGVPAAGDYFVFESVGGVTLKVTLAALQAAISAGEPFNNSIHGLTYAPSLVDAVNDITVQPGGSVADLVHYMPLDAALTKQLDVAWAPGNNAGGLDTAPLIDTEYYIWLIGRSDTGAVDILFSLSPFIPTMPANYDFKRRIGWFRRAAGAIIPFNTYEIEGGGIEYVWTTPRLDIDLLATLTTARRLDILSVPLGGFSVRALIRYYFVDNSVQSYIICCPDEVDLAPSITIAPLSVENSVSGHPRSGQLEVRTSLAGSIASRSLAAAVDVYRVVTLGFKWARRN